MINRPEIVYKYEGFNINSLTNLKAQSLYFGSPRNFNDPFDCAINATVTEVSLDQIELVRQSYLKDLSLPLVIRNQFETFPPDMLQQLLITNANKFLIEAREKFLDTRGVTCFSERNDDLIMWANYGDKYKGFCLEFKTHKDPFTKLRKVQYNDTMPHIDIVDVTVNKNYGKLLDDLYCTKSSSWKYEKEWRAIHKDSGKLFGYEADALRAIYFGPDIKREALEIVCLIIQGQNPEVQFYKGKRSETEFKVEFEKFTYTSFIDAKLDTTVPPGWGGDLLSEYIDTTYQNTLASYANLRPEYNILYEIFLKFGKIIDHIQNPKDLYSSYFLMRVQCLFMGSISLSMAGQAYETYMVLRGCLEASLYGLYISQNSKMLQIWLDRENDHESKNRCRKAFSANNTLECLKKIDSEIFKITQRLYDITIDLGAHPNRNGMLSKIDMSKEDKTVIFKTKCLSGGDTEMFLSLKTCAQVGICSLQIFKNIFPQIFDTLGITDDLDQLCTGL